jgi:hypothetical protein
MTTVLPIRIGLYLFRSNYGNARLNETIFRLTQEVSSLLKQNTWTVMGNNTTILAVVFK